MECLLEITIIHFALSHQYAIGKETTAGTWWLVLQLTGFLTIKISAELEIKCTSDDFIALLTVLILTL